MSGIDHGVAGKLLGEDFQTDGHLTPAELHGYVVSSLAEDDLECVQAHLDDCAMCRLDVADHRRQLELEAEEARVKVAALQHSVPKRWRGFLPALGMAAVIGAGMFVIGKSTVVAANRARISRAVALAANRLSPPDSVASVGHTPGVTVVSTATFILRYPNPKDEKVTILVFEEHDPFHPLAKETQTGDELELHFPRLTESEPVRIYQWRVETASGTELGRGSINLVISAD